MNILLQLYHTVDGSEIRRENHLLDVLETLVNNGRFQLPTSLNWCKPQDFETPRRQKKRSARKDLALKPLEKKRLQKVGMKTCRFPAKGEGPSPRKFTTGKYIAWMDCSTVEIQCGHVTWPAKQASRISGGTWFYPSIAISFKFQFYFKIFNFWS